MKMNDEELQNKIQQGISDDSLDGRAYKKVFNALEKEPFVLNSSFADNLMHKIESRASLRKDYFWFGIGIFTFVVAAAFAVVFANIKLDSPLLHLPDGFSWNFSGSYTGLFIFGLVFIVMLQIIDKRFVQRKSGLGVLR